MDEPRAVGRVQALAVTLYRDTGVVLRVQKLGEADRIVTLLTRRRGKVRAVAKGVRRTRSRWGARLEPFNHVDVQCYTGRSLDVVTQAQTVDAFGAGIVGDYPRYTAGCAVLETADRLVAEEGDPRCGCTCWSSARSGRSPTASATRRWCSTPSSCAP